VTSSCRATKHVLTLGIIYDDLGLDLLPWRPYAVLQLPGNGRYLLPVRSNLQPPEAPIRSRHQMIASKPHPDLIYRGQPVLASMTDL